MEEDIAKDLAYQMMQHINYTGDTEEFTEEILALIKEVEEQCAKVVLATPIQLFAISKPTSLLGLIASAVRG